MRLIRICLSLAVAGALGLNVALAQRTENFKSPQYEYQTAVDLFNKEKYGSAQQYFKYVFENTEDKQHDLKTNSLFYQGVCAAKLDNQDAGYLLQSFIDKYPVHTSVPEARYYLGSYYFSRKNYKKTIAQFEQIYESEIQPENISEYHFKKGYSYFMNGDKDNAKMMFRKASENEGKYQLRSLYYLAYMAYQDGKYDEALEGFLKIKNEPEFHDEVPYFLTQIYFKEGDYEKVLEVAPDVQKPKDKNQAQVVRCVALSHYNLNNYEEAAATFAKAKDGVQVEFDRNDRFAMGFTNYRVKEYDEAISNFSKAVNDKSPDKMTQQCYFLIADCYMKTGQRTLAAQSFKEASKHDFDPVVKEESLFNYAKLQCETSTSPFNNGIEALQDYLNTYPHGKYSDEAADYLSRIYLSTKNYQAAISSIEKFKTKNPAILKAYQRCTFNRALEQVNNKNYKDAVSLLNKTLTAPVDKKTHLDALYWKAEAQYRNEQYKDAYSSFHTYQNADRASSNEYFVDSYYSLGYSALKLKRYRDASTAFKNYLGKTKKSQDTEIQADASARLADCYFMQLDLPNAIKYYDQCERLGQSNADYAIYQLAKCYGYQKNNNKKIQTLERLLNSYGSSNYKDDAEYDLAVTYHSQNDFTSAISAYKSFIKNHPKSQYIRQAHTRLAQAYLNNDNPQMAISTYKYVVETYPGSQESKDALANLETIYTENGNTSEFFDYVRSKNMNISADRQDSIAFRAAETKYNRGDCEASVAACRDYIRQFPNGSFVAKAHFYKAECEYGMKQYSEALADYEVIIKKYKTEHNVTALHKAASILYNDKQYSKALTYFNKLMESTTSDDEVIYANNGAMRCAYFLKEYRSALTSAGNIIRMNQPDQDLLNEALLIAGNSALELGEVETAKGHYAQLVPKGSNDLCAEAAYHLADIALNKENNLADCEARIKAILGSDYSSEYWYARTFILYGDLYKAKGNYFQARHTYQSIVDNYSGDDLVGVAKKKIAELDGMEN
ncbi:MAG: tetratricopeptide repeat protein [Bacteroidales bacterium]|nr:tetratricopeptide repeat protein [Bacteroidales bacterium]